MVTFLLIVKHKDGEVWDTVGKREAAALPRIGEHIELTVDGTACLYRVMAINHADTPTGFECILFGAYVGETHILVRRLLAQA